MAPGALTDHVNQTPPSAQAEKAAASGQFNAQATAALANGVPAATSDGTAPTGKTFARQHELPKLPIPKLEDTCQRYLRSLTALQVSLFMRDSLRCSMGRVQALIEHVDSHVLGTLYTRILSVHFMSLCLHSGGSETDFASMCACLRPLRNTKLRKKWWRNSSR